MRVLNLTNSFDFVLIDDEDYEKLSKYKWALHNVGNPKYGNRYIRRIPRSKLGPIYLHRFILKLGVFRINPIYVDHINRNIFDCRKNNLRKCSFLENSYNFKMYKNNTSGIPGVVFNPLKSLKWEARINVNGERITLGFFNTKNEAALVRINAEKIYHKEFSRCSIMP